MARPLSELGRRERRIMDSVFRRGQATAAEVRADLPEPPSYSTVRSVLRLLNSTELSSQVSDLCVSVPPW
jgi:BlaI family transcriptional regulator, penicillinase repressor